jgi:hypothetical protein
MIFNISIYIKYKEDAYGKHYGSNNRIRKLKISIINE